MPPSFLNDPMWTSKRKSIGPIDQNSGILGSMIEHAPGKGTETAKRWGSKRRQAGLPWAFRAAPARRVCQSWLYVTSTSQTAGSALSAVTVT
jgi:hypothetical protein